MRRFVHIPKTAGRSVIRFLRENKLQVLGPTTKADGTATKKHRTAYKYYCMIPNEERFCIVRNPYARLVSFYNYSIRLGWLDPEYPWTQFVMDRPHIKPLRVNQPWRQQVDYIMYDGKFYVHKKLKLENINETLPRYLQTWRQLPKENVSTRRGASLSSYYQNSMIIDRVRKDFKQDFKHLHYSKVI